MKTKITQTIALKEELIRIFEPYGLSESDRLIIDALTFATNTMPNVETALSEMFAECVGKEPSFRIFIKSVLRGFLVDEDWMPVCCEAILKFYPELELYVLRNIPHLVRWNVQTYSKYIPVTLDAGTIKVPIINEIKDEAVFTAMSGYSSKGDYPFVEKMLNAKETNVYYVKSDIKLCIGDKDVPLHQGVYTVFYGYKSVVIKKNGEFFCCVAERGKLDEV